MNINMQGFQLPGSYGLKSTQERMDRQAKRDNQIAFFEQQKENLKNMKSDSIEDISRKLEMFHSYEDQIAAAKAEYNHSQMQHVMDEAIERGEKIAEAAEKFEPKTEEMSRLASEPRPDVAGMESSPSVKPAPPEERREDMIEEATGVEKDEGLLSDLMDELDDFTEELSEEMLDEVEDLSGELPEVLPEEDITRQGLETEVEEIEKSVDEVSAVEVYQPFDYRV